MRRWPCSSSAVGAPSRGSLVVSLALLELLALGRAATAFETPNGTALATTGLCPFNQQLMAGAESCSPPCNLEGTAACIALNAGGGAAMCAPGNASSSTDGCPLVQATNACDYQCIPWSEKTSPSDAFTFYLAPEASTNASEWGRGMLWQNQRFVRTIGAMDMPNRIKYVTFVGGQSVVGATRGDVLDARIALSLSGANVTNLTLANLRMTTELAPSVRVKQLKPRLQALSMLNCQLSTLPVDTSTLTALTAMDLSRNQLVSFSKIHSMESLQYLNLSNNNLTTFDATYPALQTLDLSNNQLVAIPSNVFLFSKLKSLDMSGNPLASSTFSSAQYWFLNNLTELSITGFSDELVCKSQNQQLLRAHVVCILDSDDLVVLKKSSLTWYIVIPIIATAILSGAGFSLWYYKRKKHHAKRNGVLRVSTKNTTGSQSPGEDGDDFVRMRDGDTPSNEGRLMGKKGLQNTGSLWSDEDLLACQLRYEDIEDMRQIGVGAFAVVWLVTYRQARHLASKRLVRDTVNRKKTQEFVAEIKLNAQLEHPAIVEFVGAAWTVESDLQALFEYMANGDLRGYLDATRSDATCTEWTPLKTQIAIEITEALVYVHSFTPPLVHRDLKSKNVLLNADMKAKLSDFGVSRFASENGTMTAGVGTGKWLAPEVLAGESDYNQTCDIYSLGVVLSELDTHAVPYEELQQADVATLQLVLSGHARPRFSETCPPEILDLALRCLSTEPTDRPSAMEVAFTLRTFARTL